MLERRRTLYKLVVTYIIREGQTNISKQTQLSDARNNRCYSISMRYDLLIQPCAFPARAFRETEKDELSAHKHSYVGCTNRVNVSSSYLHYLLRPPLSYQILAQCVLSFKMLVSTKYCCCCSIDRSNTYVSVLNNVLYVIAVILPRHF